MKKIYKLILCAGIAVLSLGSCSKDFLDERPTEDIAAEDLAEAVKLDPDLLSGNIAGLYSTMLETETGGTTGHDDFGQKGYDIYMDLLSGDMALFGVVYGWYSGLARLTTPTDFTNNNNYIPWRYYYRIIFAANTVIDALGGTEAVPEDKDSRHYMGQAKAMRAYAYFYLANLYSKEGYGTGQEKILPIYTNTTVPNQPLATSAEVYNLIISDLEDAIELLSDFNRSSKEQVNQDVASGLLAYALSARASQADLERVVTITDELIANYPLTSRGEVVAELDNDGKVINPESGFNDVNTPSWIWGVNLTQELGLNLVSWWGQVDVFTYSYAYVGDKKGIDKALFDAIPADDIRKKQFHTDYTPRNKFFVPLRQLGGTRYPNTAYIYMRADEMVLLNAEAKAKLNRDGEAINSLQRLLSLRVDDLSYLTTLSGQALKDEIFKQTRIELWGEGKSYLSMKRNKLTVVRGTNHLFEVGVPYLYNDEKLTLSIPQAEVLNNPVLYN